MSCPRLSCCVGRSGTVWYPFWKSIAVKGWSMQRKGPRCWITFVGNPGSALSTSIGRAYPSVTSLCSSIIQVHIQRSSPDREQEMFLKQSKPHSNFVCVCPICHRLDEPVLGQLTWKFHPNESDYGTSRWSNVHQPDERPSSSAPERDWQGWVQDPLLPQWAVRGGQVGGAHPTTQGSWYSSWTGRHHSLPLCDWVSIGGPYFDKNIGLDRLEISKLITCSQEIPTNRGPDFGKNSWSGSKGPRYFDDIVIYLVPFQGSRLWHRPGWAVDGEGPAGRTLWKGWSPQAVVACETHCRHARQEGGGPCKGCHWHPRQAETARCRTAPWTTGKDHHKVSRVRKGTSKHVQGGWLCGGFTPCRHLRPSSGREHTIVTYSVRW